MKECLEKWSKLDNPNKGQIKHMEE